MHYFTTWRQFPSTSTSTYNAHIWLISGQRGYLLLQTEEWNDKNYSLTLGLSLKIASARYKWSIKLLHARNKLACTTYHPTKCESFTPFPNELKRRQCEKLSDIESRCIVNRKNMNLGLLFFVDCFSRSGGTLTIICPRRNVPKMPNCYSINNITRLAHGG